MEDLRRIGHQVWFDRSDILAGEQILNRVSQGLDGADILLFTLSESSTQAPFVEIEWLAAIWQELRDRDIIAIPPLLDDTDIPLLLRGRRYADFRSHYIVGWTQLVTSLGRHTTATGLVGYRPDVVDMNEDRTGLFTETTTLDLVLMYGATWRNTHRKHLEALLGNGGRIRVILPDPAPDSPAVSTYAHRLGIDQHGFTERVHAAITDFHDLGPGVEIHLARTVFPHALYLFDTCAIIALYAMCYQRIPTPAFICRPGDVTEFARTDFEHLLETHTRPAEAGL